MAAHALFALTLLAASAAAQHAPLNTPAADTANPKLAGKRFPFNQIPFKADTSPPNATTLNYRGAQSGYNQCNSTTAGQNSMCQTAMLNSIDDFCLWGPQDPNSPIGNTEGEEVAWCTKPQWGARTIPAGAITGLQFIKTPSYVLVAGHINQQLLNLPANDYGGELDSGGQDLRGNPIGGLVYSTQLSGGKGLPAQSPLWHSFIGGGIFCFKACDMNAANSVGLCYHKLDRLGCAWNIPTAMEPNTFLSCLGDDQQPPGVYTSNGQVLTYTQPPESLGEISTMPYEVSLPATSACTTFKSAEIFAGLPSGAGIPSDPNPATKTSTSTTTTAVVSTPTFSSTGRLPTTRIPTTTSDSDAADATSTDPAGTGAAGRSVELSFFIGAAAVLFAVAARI
ncbi:hypothetical protein EXIGLDRAFT_721314 [Exidia glandulosa HHB12029]|uniref:Macrofage activating glyco protein n=1 Tax=Exidia glandulosa HHB12029 TaxID=1314781 RepID=A0A165NCD9_EXIGL|nr:hypothetical protein EXIGLDRAFT_721314 [Exidia glandulosa HHB12029]